MKKKLSQRKKKWIERTVKNDRSYKSMLYNRFFVFLFSALAQVIGLVIIALLLVYNSRWAFILQTLVTIAALGFTLYVLNRHDRPSTRMNWIIVILALPVFGVPMYLFNGGGRPTRKMHKKIVRIQKEQAELVREFYGEQNALQSQKRADGIARYMEKYARYPVFFDGSVDYYRSGEEMFPVMLDELKKAEKYILVEYFIIAHGRMWNEILKILLEKAEQGVQVRIIYDDFGCMLNLPPRYDEYLETLSPNIRCMTFNDVVPVFAVRMNNRDHRKILVVDGKVAFTGGINLADEYIAEKKRFGYWKDTGIRVTGNGVSSFVLMFFYLWNAFYFRKEDIRKYLLPYTPTENTAENTCLRILPYDDSPLDRISVGESVYSDMINRAARYVYVFTPYLILDDFMRSALCQAAMRGVDVRIVTPGIPDKKMTYRLTRANYQTLIKAGVKIYEYTPGFIHAKSMVCDDEYAVVGTINMDYRSLYLHFENAVYFSGCDAVLDLKRDCEEVFAVSRQCSPQYPKRSVLGRFVDSILRSFETLL